MTCTHDTNTAHNTTWECDTCGHHTPMTPTELDWNRTDIPTCHYCRHSAAPNNPLTTTRTYFPTQKTRLAHQACIDHHTTH